MLNTCFRVAVRELYVYSSIRVSTIADTSQQGRLYVVGYFRRPAKALLIMDIDVVKVRNDKDLYVMN